VRAADEVVPVFHGTQVETTARGFVEGAWNGAFDGFDLAAATVICGTGGTAGAGRVRFYASTDQYGLLFSVRTRDAVHVSNSPAFVLEMSGEEPDPIYPFYIYDLTAIFRQGLHCPDGRLRLRSGNTLHVHYTTVVSVERHGRVRFDRHPVDRVPIDFRSYESMLRAGTRDVLANAADPQRRHRYLPLAMLSRGYDSTATTILARDAGARDTFTYVDSRHEEPDRDSGTANARALGMTCTEYDRWRYLDLGRPVEVEFGCGPLSSHVPIAAAEEQLRGRLLIVGQNGDTVWNPRRARVFKAMARAWGRFAAAMTEADYRLRVGYPIFAPACIVTQHNGALHAIGTAAEMQPWAVGGTYDRPVPRRIGEEAGLARDAFGTRKIASSHTHLTDASRFSKSSLDSYRGFVDALHGGVPARDRRRWEAHARRRQRLWNLLGRKQRFVPTSPLQRRLPFLLNAPPIPIPWEFMFTFQWSIAALRDRYRVAAEVTAPSSLRPAAPAEHIVGETLQAP
jgi:hypothetical protein